MPIRGSLESSRGEGVKDEMRICRGVKSVFVLDALETADIVTIRPSFRAKETVRAREWDSVLFKYWCDHCRDSGGRICVNLCVCKKANSAFMHIMTTFTQEKYRLLKFWSF